MARYCSNCGNETGEGTRFCSTCGAPAVAPPPAAAPGAPVAPWSQPRPAVSPWPIVLIVGIVVLVVGGAIFALAISHKKSSKTAVKVGGITVVATSPHVTTTTRKRPALYRAYVQQLENIVQQSTRGRGIVGPLVGDVKGCRIAPNDASSQIRVVMDNRTSVLNQLAGLAPPPNTAAAHLKSLLQQSLQSSIDADAQYKAWMDYLYGEWYYAEGCPNGAPPENSAFGNAQRNDANSTALKTEFVQAFNPVAAGFGFRTWEHSDF